MRHTPIHILLLAVVVVLWGCNKVEPRGPAPRMLEAKIRHPVSHYRMPIYYPINRFEEWLNAKIDGKFVDHGFPVNDGKDSLYLEATKSRPITMAIEKGRLVYSLPVALKGNYFKSVLGIKIGHRHPIETSIVLHISSDVEIDNEWKIVAKSRLDRVEWKEDPVLRIGPLRIPLRRYLQNMIDKKEAEFLGKMDSAVYEHINLRKAIDKVWRDIQKPMPIVKEEPKVWFKIRAEEVYGELSLDNPSDILFDVLVAAHTEIGLDSLELAGAKPLPDVRKKLPPIDTLTIAVKGLLPFELANQLLRERVRDLEIENYGMRIKVRRAMMYGTEDGIAIQLEVSGYVNGMIYLVGQPEYLEAKKQLVVTNLAYHVNTESMLINAANRAIYDYALAFLSDYLVLYVGDEMRRLPALISGAIEKGRSAERFDLNIDTLDIRKWDFLVTRHDIQFVLAANAQASIEIERLKVKKQVMIGSDTPP